MIREICKHGSYQQTRPGRVRSGRFSPQDGGGHSRSVFSLVLICSNQKKKDAGLGSYRLHIRAVSLGFVDPPPLPFFPCGCIDPASSHLPAPGGKTNPAQFMWDPGLVGKGMLWKKELSSHLFYIFKCFVVFGLSFLDF